MNLRKPHQEILKTLWGVDIAKFPAHLSTINLAVNDLSVDENYPQILNEDFFNLSPIEKMGGEEMRKKELKTLGIKRVFIPYPRTVDCIIGNPPYTRQEEITEITGKESYKESMISKALLMVKENWLIFLRGQVFMPISLFMGQSFERRRAFWFYRLKFMDGC